jgi:hypothetical protein
MTTCPHELPVALPPGDGEYPQNMLRHSLEEHVMAQHLGHQTGVSSLLSPPHMVSPWHPHSWRPQQLNLAPVRCHICTYKEPNDSINIYTIYTCYVISKNIYIKLIKIPR